jgi:hexosaminidase
MNRTAAAALAALATLATISAVAAAPAAAQNAPSPPATGSLMPVPRSVTWRQEQAPLILDSTFRVTLAGVRDARLSGAVRRMLVRLRGRTALALATVPAADGSGATLVVRADAPGQAVQGTSEDESYQLDVSAARAGLHAATVVGALRGLETFLQLVEADARGYHVNAVGIDDAPRFPWRGLLVDVGRHFMPPEVIRRTLDGMAAVKLNVLHWHLSEDQGFRVESRRYPRLQQMGSDGLYYTRQQIREIVAYARERGIRVVPEFDMPGHSSSWLVGYPQYSAGEGPYQIVREFGVFDPVFDPTREEVYRFLDGFIGEMVGLFPDAYWHVGGDEVNGRQWAANPRIQAYMRAHHLENAEALQVHFNQRLLRILTKYHKRMVGWDEIYKPGLPTDAVIHSWRGTESLGRAARQGYSGILSAPYYLDQQFTAEAHYLPDPLPAGTDLTPEQQARVLGGEACMWAEHVTPETIDSRIWPRLIAVAERLWSPREVRDLDDMYRRLWVTSARLEELGLQHEGHTARMLRLVAGPEAAELTRLLRVTQPATFGQRGQLQRPNQLTPLAYLVDAARPDPPARWETVRMARRVIAAPQDSATRADLTTALGMQQQAARRLVNRGVTSPAMAQVMPAAIVLDSLAGLGLEAVRAIERGERAGADWTSTALASLQRWERPQGLLRLTAVDAVRLLVKAAGGQ